MNVLTPRSSDLLWDIIKSLMQDKDEPIGRYESRRHLSPTVAVKGLSL